MHNTHNVELFTILLMITAAVSMTVKWIKLPYSIMLVIVGLIMGLCGFLPDARMTPEIILLLCLPALLFEAAWNLHLDELKQSWKLIGVLATVGVLVSMFAVGMALAYLAGVGLHAALLIGAMTAATDPISVVALFRKLGIDKRLTAILEGESLFNDGTAVVLFNLILAASAINAAGASTPISNINWPATIFGFFATICGGAAVGLVAGIAASKVTAFFDDHLLEITLTTILAYGTYLIAEHLHVSPVIAVVCAGVVMGNYGSRTAMSPTTRLAVNSFWEYLAFIVNSLVFLLIGLQINLSLLTHHWLPIVVTIASALTARAIGVFVMTALFPAQYGRISAKWQALLVWGGLRGALCMALALSLPPDFAERETIIVTTFGFVLFTLVASGLSMEPLVKLLKVASIDKSLDIYKSLQARLKLNALAAKMLELKIEHHEISQKTYDVLKERLQNENTLAKSQLDQLHLSDENLQEIELQDAIIDLHRYQKDLIVDLSRNGSVSHESAQRLIQELDKSSH